MQSELASIDSFEIPVIGLGTMKLEGKECEKTVRKALEVGYRHIDTAVIYENESAVGNAIEKFDRKKLFITTKVWKDKLGYEDFIKSVERSLERLGTSYIDLLLIHRPNPEIQFKETTKAMNELTHKKKIRNLGVSNFNIPQLRQIQKLTEQSIVTNQVKYHVGMNRSSLLSYCQKNDVLLTAYSPLARGEVIEQELLQQLGEKYDKSAEQIAIKWLIQQDNVITIPRTTSKDHMRENLQIFDWNLEEKDMEKLKKLTVNT